MKNLKSFLLLALSLFVVSYFVEAQNVRTNPDKANYFIKGNLSIEMGNAGKPVYKLSDISSKGITFKDPGKFIIGKETDKEDVLFQFSHVKTDYPDGIETKLDFWRYDESINEWQPDVETRQGSAGMEETKSMVVMLVLDCSTSLGEDFKFVQEAAKNFARNLLNASKGGNIKIGIVSFSKINETKFLDIRPLTSGSYSEIERFINGLSMQNGTALYYAMDKSIDIVEEYCKTSISTEQPLSTAMMVTFTDGLDQTSRDAERNIFTADDYYKEILKKTDRHINGVPLRSIIRGVQGDDIISSAQLGKFKSVGESLGDFKLLGSISELSSDFENIAMSLINEWRVLNCYVPNSFKGQVAWTYPQKVKPKIFVGINLGGGIMIEHLSGWEHKSWVEASWHESGGWYSENINLNKSKIIPKINIGLNLAFPVGKKCNLGLYFSGGYPDLSAGPLLLVNFNKASLYIGTGVCYLSVLPRLKGKYYYERPVYLQGMHSLDKSGMNLRLGIVTNKHIYMFIDVDSFVWKGNYEESCRSDEGYFYVWHTPRVATSFHIGYYF